MPKTVFGGAHATLVEVVVAARKRSELTQVELAAKLGKDQTFISLIERGQRRIDVVEFIALAQALGEDPEQLFRTVVAQVPAKLDI